jgi:ribosomal-protein-alanine N-acetyltransferase
MNTIKIDDMALGDLDAVLEIDLDSFAPSELSSGGPEAVRAVRERSLREEFARTWSVIRVARRESGVPLGYCLFWSVVDELEIINIAVASASRRQGVGQLLMGDLLAYAQAHDVKRILLEARAGNTPALTLYDRFGFRRFNVRHKYYADGEDAVEMSLELGARDR